MSQDGWTNEPPSFVVLGVHFSFPVTEESKGTRAELQNATVSQRAREK